jgi:hypothetical protein
MQTPVSLQGEAEKSKMRNAPGGWNVFTLRAKAIFYIALRAGKRSFYRAAPRKDHGRISSTHLIRHG